MSEVTESSTNYYLVGELLDKISEEKLPTHKEVLSRFLYCHFIQKKAAIASYKDIAADLEKIYEKLVIPTQHRSRIQKKIKTLHLRWVGIKKNKSRINSKQQKCNEEKFSQLLCELFDVSHNGSLNSMSIEEKERLGFRGPVVIAERLNERMEYWNKVKDQRRQNEDVMRSTLEIEEIDESSANLNRVSTKFEGTIKNVSQIAERSVSKEEIQIHSVDTYAPSDENENSDSFDDLYVPPNEKKKVKKKDNIMTHVLSAALDRSKISNRSAVYVLAAAASSMNKNPANMVLNRESFRQSREVHREAMANKIRQSFNRDTPLVVHWDGKLVPINDKIEKVDRIAVVVSGGGSSKLLGIPYIHKSVSSGENQADLVYTVLEDWDLLDKIEFMSFDTTSVNSGRLNETCVLLQKLLGRRLFWLACRHHIMELILKYAYKTALNDVSTSPKIQLFENFEKRWEDIDKSKYQSGLEDPKIVDILLPIKEKLTSFVNNQLTKYKHRDDYKEVLSLTLLFLGERPKDYCMLACRPFNRARWMTPLIYCMKIYLFRSQFNLTSLELSGLQNFNVFAVSTYIEYWFKAPCTLRAATNDLKMLKSLDNYKKINANIANAAILAFSRHLWYLSEQLTGITLFDDSLGTSEKKAVLQALKKAGCKNPPVRPKIDTANVQKLTISDFVTKNSLEIFTAINISQVFLDTDPDTWNDRDDYKQARDTIKNLNVVNDAAERGVAMATTFNGILTKDEGQRQFLLQVVESHRKNYPNSNKKTVLKALTF